ncbi:hypothetical protein KFK09_019951 [Dendrobium nobile]|uniref:Uncharacterized protein n=1 Tax=Dendrobium nobile TaxID=94219 RepID=A0A8T3ASF5_DENNO|nr:hypothetical protein KFK09_019951 [Dendrobium nobile]
MHNLILSRVRLLPESVDAGIFLPEMGSLDHTCILTACSRLLQNHMTPIFQNSPEMGSLSPSRAVENRLPLTPRPHGFVDGTNKHNREKEIDEEKTRQIKLCSWTFTGTEQKNRAHTQLLSFTESKNLEQPLHTLLFASC